MPILFLIIVAVYSCPYGTHWIVWIPAKLVERWPIGWTQKSSDTLVETGGVCLSIEGSAALSEFQRVAFVMA